MGHRRLLRTEPVTFPREGWDQDDVVLMRVTGATGASWAAGFRAALARHETGAAHLVLDLSEVRTLGAAAVWALMTSAQRLSDRRRRLLLVGVRPEIRERLSLGPAASTLEMFASWEQAKAALAVPRGPVDDSHRTGDLHRACRLLWEQARSRPLVSRAQGVLMERYGLPNSGNALSLMNAAAQRYGLTLPLVASALLAERRRPPADGSVPWFDGQDRPRTPELPFLPATTQPTSRRGVLAAVLAEALRVTGARRGDVQVLDEARDLLVVEVQRGFPHSYAEVFARAGEVGAAAAARRSGRRVVVTDIAHDAVHACHPCRQLVREAGARAVQCTPVLDSDGRCVGVISTYSPHVGHRPGRAEERRLDALAEQTAGWLTWHRHCVVREALELVHRCGAAVGRKPVSGGSWEGGHRDRR